jgi:hypothetical protein
VRVKAIPPWPEARGADPSRRGEVLKDHNRHVCVGSGCDVAGEAERNQYATMKPKKRWTDLPREYLH